MSNNIKVYLKIYVISCERKAVKLSCHSNLIFIDR